MRRAKKLVSLLWELSLYDMVGDTHVIKVQRKLHRVMRKLTLRQMSVAFINMSDAMMNRFWHEHSYLYI